MALVRKELIRPVAAQVAGEDAFRFRHQLIRDAAYDALAKQDRAELHEQFAAWFEPRSIDRVERDELLGYHYEQAYRYRATLGSVDARGRELATLAADRLAAAAKRATELDDDPAVARLLERATSLLPAESPARIELLIDLGVALASSAAAREADPILEEAVDARSRSR